MIDIKICLLFLFLASLAASSKRNFDQRSLALRLLHNLEQDESQDALDQLRRNYKQKSDENNDEIESDRRVEDDDADEIESDRRAQDDDADDESLDSRDNSKSNATSTGPVITLKNSAAMNTRLRVLYTDENCAPFLAESGLLMTAQTKSVTLPKTARNIKVIVQKDIFAENWRIAYTDTLAAGKNLCIRITGVTVSSKIKKCK